MPLVLRVVVVLVAASVLTSAVFYIGRMSAASATDTSAQAIMEKCLKRPEGYIFGLDRIREDRLDLVYEC